MATRKARRLRPRKRTIRRHRTSTAGKILPPIDVRSSKHLKEFEKRIKSGPLTIILVYADWCPHCHTMMPHFDAAAKSANRSIQAVKVNETMMPAINSTVTSNINKAAKRIDVNSFPSIIVVNNKGEKVTDIEPVRNTKTMTDVMSQSGPLATEAGLNENPTNVAKNTAAPKNASATTNSIVRNDKFMKNIGVDPRNIDIGEDELKGSIAATNNKKARPTNSDIEDEPMEIPEEAISVNVEAATNSLMAPNSVNVTAPSKNVKKEAEEAEEITSMVAPLTPPSVSNDMESDNTMTGGSRGGSLYATMARTAYTLAPAAALLATAGIVIRGKKHKGTRRVKHFRRVVRRPRKSTRRQQKRR